MYIYYLIFTVYIYKYNIWYLAAYFKLQNKLFLHTTVNYLYTTIILYTTLIYINI